MCQPLATKGYAANRIFLSQTIDNRSYLEAVLLPVFQNLKRGYCLHFCPIEASKFTIFQIKNLQTMF